jgi:hypothetical protein
MPSIENLYIAPAQVVWGGDDMGWTSGGTTFSFSDSYADVNVDQHGSTMINKINSGTEVSAGVPLAELTHKNLALITGEVEEIEVGGPGRRVKIHSRTGCRLIDGARELILKPLDCGVPTADRNRWYTCPLANWEVSAEQTFDPEGLQVWNGTLWVFPDPAQDMLLFTYGDTSF